MNRRVRVRLSWLRRSRIWTAAAIVAAVLLPGPAFARAPRPVAQTQMGVASSGGTTMRVSVAPDGSAANGDSYVPAISADGQVVVYVSLATNLVVPATAGYHQVFAYDFSVPQTISRTALMSADPAGSGGNDSSYASEISADGQYVAFYSYAKNLLGPGVDSNQKMDVFVRERATPRLFRVSVRNGDGAQGNGHSQSPAISGSGRHVAFRSGASNLVEGGSGVHDIYTHDWAITDTARISVGVGGAGSNGDSHEASISGDGMRVAFVSYASNLVPGDTNNKLDVFVYDRTTGTMVRASVDSGGVQSDGDSNKPAISLDGRWVAFASKSEHLVEGDDNEKTDVFVHDLLTGSTRRVSVSSTGEQSDGTSTRPAISEGGRFVAFHSEATNLVSGDGNGSKDVFVHDLWTGQTVRVSVRSDGTERSGSSELPAISADGCVIAFQSKAQLAPEDTDDGIDIYVHRWPCAAVFLPQITASAEP